MTQQTQQAPLVDKTIKTDKGPVRIIFPFNFGKMMEDLDYYQDMFMMARGLPFDMESFGTSDPMVLYASNTMPWIEQKEDVIRIVRQHYEKLIQRARRDAAIVAVTAETPDFEFEPEPYPSQDKKRRTWGMSLPDPELNLMNPLEKRLKQIYDALETNVAGAREFQGEFETLLVEIERRSRALQADENGFPNGNSDNDVHKEAEPDSKE